MITVQQALDSLRDFASGMAGDKRHWAETEADWGKKNHLLGQAVAYDDLARFCTTLEKFTKEDPKV